MFKPSHLRGPCACLAAVALAAALSGCGAKTGPNALTKDEKALMSAPPGQPMPEEARKAMAAAQQAPPPPPAAKGATP
ncbi:MAG TPA: hypothetical protein VM490_03825 [Armatimonadaceae bacterium]|nr:hypothetical protein [Armatimonadaceae bacterium]